MESSSLTNNINMMLFGEVSNTSEATILQNISSLRSQINAYLEQLEELPTLRRRAVTDENIRSLKSKWPTLQIGYSGGTTSLLLAEHHVNFLYGSLQERENIKNTAIIYQTTPRYATKILVHPNRAIEVSNATMTTQREMLSMQRNAAMNQVRDLSLVVPPDMSLRGYNSPSDGHSLAHPHAQGSASQFTSICYGNNKWSEALSRANNGSDVISAFDRAMLWASSANMLDMYGNYLSPGFTPPDSEWNLPPQYREVMTNIFQLLINRLQRPVLAYANDKDDFGITLARDDEFAELCDELLTDLPDFNEFSEVFSKELILSLRPTTDTSSTSFHPIIWALFALRDLITNDSTQNAPGLPNYGASISIVLAILKKAYAMWMLLNYRHIHNCKSCFVAALRTEAYTMSRYTALTGLAIKQALKAPLGMYSVYQHAGAQQSALTAINVCNFNID